MIFSTIIWVLKRWNTLKLWHFTQAAATFIETVVLQGGSPQLHVEKAHEGSLTIDPILNSSNLRYLHQLSDSKLGHHL